MFWPRLEFCSLKISWICRCDSNYSLPAVLVHHFYCRTKSNPGRNKLKCCRISTKKKTGMFAPLKMFYFHTPALLNPAWWDAVWIFWCNIQFSSLLLFPQIIIVGCSDESVQEEGREDNTSTESTLKLKKHWGIWGKPGLPSIHLQQCFYPSLCTFECHFTRRP